MDNKTIANILYSTNNNSSNSFLTRRKRLEALQLAVQQQQRIKSIYRARARFLKKQAQQYYGSILGKNLPSSRKFFSAEQQKSPFENENSLGTFIGTAGLFAAAGAIPIGEGRRLVDYYFRAARAIEEYSPAKILRTFQVSPFLSQFVSAPRYLGKEVTNTLSGEFLQKNKIYLDYLANLIGDIQGVNVYKRLREEGVVLKEGKLLFGNGGVALEHASAIFGPAKKSTIIGEAYYLSRGMNPKEYGKFARAVEEAGIQIIGGKNMPEHIARQLTMFGTASIQRVNRLLETFVDIEPLRSVYKFLSEKIGLRLTVEAGTGTEMLMRLFGKYGIALPAIYGAYKTFNWGLRQTIGIDINQAVGATWAGLNLAVSSVAEVTGLHALREKQEEIAPGSTSLSRLMGFPLLGAFFGTTIAYGTKVVRAAELQKKEGLDAVAAIAKATEELASFQKENTFSRLGNLFATTGGYYAREESIIGKIIRRLAKPVEEGSERLSYKILGEIGPGKLAAGIGAFLGLAAITPFLPGALVPSKRPSELMAIYSGEQEVPIRKGRWWEAGRTKWEGERIEYFRPHWFPLMMSRAKEKSLWGPNEDEISPAEKWRLANFTYTLEQAHYADRPYPITGTPFKDVPIFGPLLSATIGRLIKPPVPMHVEEWMNPKLGAVDFGPGYGMTIQQGIGERPLGMPRYPGGFEDVIGEEFYRFSDLIGLWGFTATSLLKKVTGSAGLYEYGRRLADSSAMSSFTKDYWEKNLGGVVGTSEVFRRLFPHERRGVEEYNPIRNTMPSWLPGPNERGPDLLHGDPFRKIMEGSVRLPGEGYAALHPELKGIAPEDYPLIYRLKILADVAPYSDKYKATLSAVRAQRLRAQQNEALWSEKEEQMYQEILRQVRQKKESSSEFNEYKYLSKTGSIFGSNTYYADKSSSILSKLNKMKAEQEEKHGLLTSIYGGYWELISHGADTAFDQLTPFSPYSKFIHMRSAIEDYEVFQVWGTKNAFWDRPIENFIKPFITRTAHSLGWNEIPASLQQRRNIEAYFDMLKWIKYSRLANIAREAGDRAAVLEFEEKKDQTMFGINPYTYNFTDIYKALPARERKYFQAFSNAETQEEREKILSMVPENIKPLYKARWDLMLAQDIKKAQKAGLLSPVEEKEAENILADIQHAKATEGFPSSKELWAEYLQTRLKGESYGDWYRRTKLIEEGPAIPGPDWVGWHPSVDLEDIKLKVVETLGEDMHDYGLWESRKARLPYKPYINEEAIRPVMDALYDRDNAYNLRYNQVDRLFDVLGIDNRQIFVRNHTSNYIGPSIDVKITQRRSDDSITPEEMLN